MADLAASESRESTAEYAFVVVVSIVVRTAIPSPLMIMIPVTP